MKFNEFRQCQRTRAKTCQCESLSTIAEADNEHAIAQCVLEHSDTVKGNIVMMQKVSGGPTVIKVQLQV